MVSVPYLEGNYTDWEYVYLPRFDLGSVKKLFRLRSYAPLYRRPKVRPKHDFIYYTSAGFAILVTRGHAIDGFTIPFTVQVVSGFRLNMLMPEILWVAAVHDTLCREKIGQRPWRAEVFKEAIWYATEILLPRKAKRWNWVDRLLRRARAQVLTSGVWLGMLFGAC